jgi:regulator of sigma E protease
MGSLIGNFTDALVLFLLFSVTIFVHELCHFLTAIKLGLVVETFSIGFGPALWKIERKGIVYKLGCIPFGGYVALPQLDPAGMKTIQGATDAAGELPEVSPWKRILVAVSGVCGNIALAVVLAWVVYFSPTEDGDAGAATIGFVDPGSAAFEAGLRPGDEVLSVNGETVRSWHEFTMLSVLRSGRDGELSLEVESDDAVRVVRVAVEEGVMGETTVPGILPYSVCVVGAVRTGSPAERAGLLEGDRVVSFAGTPVVGVEHLIEMVTVRGGEASAVVVERKGRTLELGVTPELDEEAGRALMGVELRSAEMGVMPWMRYKTPWAQIRGDASEIARILRALVTPRESRQAAGALGGPVMIISMLWVSIKMSIFNAIGFLRFLNVNLAILNLLPIPVLDGGHIVFCLWEGITRRKVHPKLVNVLVNVFATLLIGVFVLLTFRDVMRLPRMFRALGGLWGEEAEAPAPIESVQGVDEPVGDAAE